MIQLLQMWALVEILGFICLPLTFTVFHNLPDRGWAFSKAIGMAVLAFAVWLPLMCFQILPYSQLLIAGVFLVILGLNIIGFLRVRHDIVKQIRVNTGYILASEAVFLGMVFLLGWIRSYGPDIRSFEMFMDEGFIAAIMRSPHLPPNDMWFSGYPINYYYYAHFTAATLGKLIGQTPSIVFNTGICIFFGLTAVNLFGVTCNIVAWARYQRGRIHNDEPADESPSTVYPSLLPAAPYGLLTMLMALVLGNLAATQQWFQLHGDLSQYDWFAPSRVIDKTINEFPAFSFLLSCFHAHVLTLAFTIVGIALAFNLFLERDGKGLHAFGRGWRLPLTLGMTALMIGGLFVMNGWDYPTYMGLTLVCLALQQWLAYKSTFRPELVLDIFTPAAALVALSFILYAPFYLSFISPSQGLGFVGPSDRTPINDELLIYGLFAFMFITLLAVTVLKRPLFGSADAEDDTAQPTRRGPSATILSIWGIALAGLLALLILRNSTSFVAAGVICALGVVLLLNRLQERSLAFTLLLGSLAFGLVAACEVVFLKDVFADNYPRMNTVFKFYFQCWALLSITSGAGLYFILDGFRPDALATLGQRRMQRSLEVVWSLCLLAFLLLGAVYPIAGSYARTDHFAQRTNSLDGLAYMQSYSPGDYGAITWLNTHVSGDPVIIESVGPDYSDYARISAFTGLPTPMGWVGHEYQWRVNWFNKDDNAAEFNRRSSDIDTIYTSTDPQVVLSLMARYHAQYLIVGALEQAKYPKANLQRFGAFMQVVYSAYGETIYKVKS
jgi:YYY domain-containing protein